MVSHVAQIRYRYQLCYYGVIDKEIGAIWWWRGLIPPFQNNRANGSYLVHSGPYTRVYMQSTELVSVSNLW